MNQVVFNRHHRRKVQRFFSSVAADLALRLGPDSERSGKIVCKKYETLWLQKTRQIRGEKTTNKNQTTATTRKSPGQICVSPAEKAANQHKKGPEPHQKSPHQNHQDASDTIGISPPCLRNMRKTKLASLWPKKAVKSCPTVKSSNKIAKSYCTLRQPPQSPLRRALSIFEQVGQLHRFWSLPQSMGVQSVGSYRNPRTRVALSSVPGSTVSCSEQCRPKTGRHRGPRQRKKLAGPDCQHITERLVEEVVQEKRHQIRW